jgi:hypothetical protein
MMEEFVSRVFALRNAAHLAHWASKSYAEHKTLGKFYDTLISGIDGIVEAYQGYYGLIGEVRINMLPKTDILGKIHSELSFIVSNRDKICQKNPILLNLLDQFASEYATTLYKLTNLK